MDMQFYPTPDSLIEKMLAPLTSEVEGYRTFKVLDYVKQNHGILEPSAGTGAILDYLQTYNNVSKEDFFAVEMDASRQLVLQGKGYSLYGMDFMEWDEAYLISLIVANPPFAQGAEHLLKMWEVVADGGAVVCLLNAETLKNPYSMNRKAVVELVQAHGEYEFVEGAFTDDAQRKTNVECAIVWLYKPEVEADSDFDLELETETIQLENDAETGIQIRPGEIKRIVQAYERARNALITYHASHETYHKALDGYVSKYKLSDVAPLNRQLQDLKTQFWGYIFEKTNMAKRVTSRFRDEFQKRQQTIGNVGFTEANIMLVIESYILNADDEIKKAARGVFETIRRMDAKNTKGEGWKSNKPFRLNYRVIVPRLVNPDVNSLSEYMYNNWDDVEDLEKVLCHLDGKPLDSILTAKEALQAHAKALRAGEAGFSDRFESEFFECRAWKKGTIHFYFKELDLLAKFNRLISDGSLPSENA